MSWIHFVTQTIAQQVESQAGEQNRPARCSGDPPLIENHFTAFCNHRAPFGGRWLNAHAKEAQTGRGQNDAAEAERRAHHGAWQAQRQNVAEHKTKTADALHPRRRQIVTAAQRQRFRPRLTPAPSPDLAMTSQYPSGASQYARTSRRYTRR